MLNRIVKVFSFLNWKQNNIYSAKLPQQCVFLTTKKIQKDKKIKLNATVSSTKIFKTDNDFDGSTIKAKTSFDSTAIKRTISNNNSELKKTKVLIDDKPSPFKKNLPIKNIKAINQSKSSFFTEYEEKRIDFSFGK